MKIHPCAGIDEFCAVFYERSGSTLLRMRLFYYCCNQNKYVFALKTEDEICGCRCGMCKRESLSKGCVKYQNGVSLPYNSVSCVLSYPSFSDFITVVTFDVFRRN